MVDEVIQTLLPFAQQKGIELVAPLDQPGAEVASDRKKCFQILLNLANNAVKFTESGSVKISTTITLENVEITVTDTGHRDSRRRASAQLFEAFRQLDGSARRPQEGTGLGLYLCKQLSTMLGGSIRAESEVRCRFAFYSLFAEFRRPTPNQ